MGNLWRKKIYHAIIVCRRRRRWMRLPELFSPNSKRVVSILSFSILFDCHPFMRSHKNGRSRRCVRLRSPEKKKIIIFICRVKSQPESSNKKQFPRINATSDADDLLLMARRKKIITENVYGPAEVCECECAFTGRIKNYHKAQSTSGCRCSTQLPAGGTVYAVKAQWFFIFSPIGRIIFRGIRHASLIQATQDKSRIQFQIGFEQNKCSFRCAVGFEVTDLSFGIYIR